MNVARVHVAQFYMKNFLEIFFLSAIANICNGPKCSIPFAVLQILFHITYAEPKFLSLFSRWIVSTFKLSYTSKAGKALEHVKIISRKDAILFSGLSKL